MDTEIPRPSLLRRLAAIVYDTFLVLPLIMASVALATGLRVLAFGTDGDSIVTLPPHLVQALAAFTVIAFYTVFWRLRGQTLGMQAWRIQLQGRDGSAVTVVQSVVRCIGATVSLALLGAGYWWCLFDRNKRCWHDYLSRTDVVLLPKKEKN